jgi:enoyl-CoA hydratase/carnithine racemase
MSVTTSRPYTYLLSGRKPIIAAINGPVAGMAVPIALCCDLRFASDRAVFTLAFSKRGLVAEWGSAWLLPRLVGPSHALDLLFSSRVVDAHEACRIGLVNRVVRRAADHCEVRSRAGRRVLADVAPDHGAPGLPAAHAGTGPSEKRRPARGRELAGPTGEGATSFREAPPRFPRV